jgi:hypothetical protein
VDVGAALIADEQAAALVQPCEGAFDDPAVAAEPRAVPAEAACDYWFDPARPELAAVGVMVIAAVGNDAIGSVARAASAAANRWDSIDERQQLGDVVAIAARQRPRQRHAAAVGQEVMLGTRTAPVDWARTGRAAPLFAWI